MRFRGRVPEKKWFPLISSRFCLLRFRAAEASGLLRADTLLEHMRHNTVFVNPGEVKVLHPAQGSALIFQRGHGGSRGGGADSDAPSSEDEAPVVAPRSMRVPLGAAPSQR